MSELKYNGDGRPGGCSVSAVTMSCGGSIRNRVQETRQWIFALLYSQSSLSKSILPIFRIAWNLSPALEIEIRYICKSKKIFRRQEPFAIILFLYIIYFKGSAAKKKSGSIWETCFIFLTFLLNVLISLHLLMWHMHPYTSVKEELVGVDSYPSVDSGG